MEKKKVVVVTLIGILTLVILTIGATYAYFQFNSQNNFDTGVNIQGSTEAVGTGAVLKSVTKSLTLDVSATDMLESNIGTSYYASGSATPATIGEISVDMDGSYACTYTLVVRDTASSYENNLYTKAMNMTSGRYAEQFYLDINDTRYTLNAYGRFPVIYTERVIIDKNNPYNITTNLVITNTDADQTALNGGDITLNYEVMDFNCEYIEEDDKVIGYAVYSENDNSLSFYNNAEVKNVNAGGTYNNKTVTAIYPINLDDLYKSNGCTSTGCTDLTTPWSEYALDITNIKVEDEIHPWNTRSWFAGLVNVTNIDVTNLKMDEVVDMDQTFRNTSSNVTDVEIAGISEFNTSNVIIMTNVFYGFVYNATTIDLDLSNWKTDSVRTFKSMFGTMGRNSTTFDIGNIGNWNVSKVENMGAMFYNTGNKSTTWNIGDLSNWNVSKVYDMSQMFDRAGYEAISWNIGDISKWDTSNVTRMDLMFSNAGVNANYTLNLSNWNVDNVVKYDNFNAGVTTKITPPTWVN